MLTRGKFYEDLAAAEVQRRGLHIIARNFSAKTGEIDIIALDQTLLVFLEVRVRRHPGYGGAAASVDRRKQRKLLRTAEVFRLTHPRYAQLSCRFDLIAFDGPQSPVQHDCQWIQGAFTA